MPELPLLSVVVPCFNEQEAILACHTRLTHVLLATSDPYEILYIDDGSTDRTPQLLQALTPPPRILTLTRNFGHQAAVTCGLEAALGAATIILDADLQDPPELIPAMLTLWRQGYQVVYGVRKTRTGETPFKLLSARAFYRALNRLSDVPIPLDTGDFRLLDRVVVDALRRMPERHRLLRGMSAWIGYNQVGLEYHRSPRYAGTTKYPLGRMWSLALDGIVGFSTVPLRLVTLTGFLSAGLAFLGIVYTLSVRLFTHAWVRGWAMSFIGMLFMAGIQLLCLGILGEYIGRIYTETRQRPLYLLRTPRDPE